LCYSDKIENVASVPRFSENWVTECTGYTGNNFDPQGVSMGPKSRVTCGFLSSII
jgi:hypothetical protein